MARQCLSPVVVPLRSLSEFRRLDSTREACLKRDGYRCRRCGLEGSVRNPLQADYISYENYNATGRTPVGDLRTLCRHCHQIITGRTFHRTFSQWLGQFWRPLTLRQKVKVIINVTIIAVAVIWLLFGAPIPRRPVPAATPNYGYGPPAYGSGTLIIPPRVQVHHRQRARAAWPRMPLPSG
jgi:5-methylcytosine-specific restriction endonuclease McrA